MHVAIRKGRESNLNKNSIAFWVFRSSGEVKDSGDYDENPVN